MTIRRLFTSAVVVLALAMTGSCDPGVARVRWTMIDVTDEHQQADAHLLEVGTRALLIDAGSAATAGNLVRFLAKRGIARIETLFISHVHEDHFGGIPALLDAGVEIGRVELSLPDDAVCEREIPWGCDPAAVDALLARLASAGIDVREPERGARWRLGAGRALVLLERISGPTPEATSIDVNDTSLVLRLDVGRTSVLFTGDANVPLGRLLTRRDLGLRDRVLLKVPHHGAEKVADNDFFEHVDADVAFVPAPADLWCSDRSGRVRGWLAENDVPVFVSGLHGDVTVVLDDTNSTVETERRGGACSSRSARSP